MPLLLLGGRTQPAEVLDETVSHEVQEHGRGPPWTRNCGCDCRFCSCAKFPEDYELFLHSWLAFINGK